ncbi:hypothetical protein B0T14DRAFT_543794 [Immersiella caudata]|uniref:Uncharacterized protein n=1 Tax=Immersiella caudata TaxID=314043 RepID=A0AA39X4C8_9PEZI|nr:hypothetical protein B0T14DRAFT_543794 [Immersiella caudata]
MPCEHHLPFLAQRILLTVSYPTARYENQTVIPHHFANLGASKIILACRSIEKGMAAKKLIEPKIPLASGTLEVWRLDLCSFDSVKEFCSRATTLSRVDVVLANVGANTYPLVLAPEAGGYETSVATNVISTLLMPILLLPRMRETGVKYNMTPRLTFIVGVAHKMAQFKERSEPKIFDFYKSTEGTLDRYTTSKLLEAFLIRELATQAKLSHTGSVMVNMANPGFCKPTTLLDNCPVLLRFFMAIFFVFFGRTAYVGALTLLAAVEAGPESYGQYLKSGEISGLSPHVSL